ncbi:hypothetical protein [Dongia sedimenti]|uniref:MBL fold metallo-hydrolase n=1 Tax=Dongia sedimenti TaxID=3064282 RepID=A0ABU0YSW0_9PROT|nr:hypothetical protein [Rhodospirillaceae bacterium R-7]
MIFSLDVRRARKGDCLLLHFGSKADPGLILIDGGPASVYTPHLKPRIAAIRAARKLKKEDPLPVDLLMVSHVDDDHIRGILDLAKDLIVEDEAHRPLPLSVLSFWHNSFDNIIGKDPKELTASFKSSPFGAASKDGALPKEATIDADDPSLEEEEITSNLKVLASIAQGAALRAAAKKLGFLTNPENDGKLIVASDESSPVEIAEGLTFTVIGPMLPEIKALQRQHDEWLKELKKAGKTPEQALAAYVDKSVPNLSSIVVLAEADGHSMLLTGDARGDKILEGLELLELVEQGGTLEVDLLKVPHHGSSNNLDDDFFERVIAKHYVFSGNGEHGNPERESLEMLLAARGNADYAVHLTYPIDEIDTAREEDWNKERAKEKKKKEANPNKKVRPAWSPEKHSLAAFVEDNPEFAAKIKIVDAQKAHVIDLGSPLGQVWPSLA